MTRFYFALCLFLAGLPVAVFSQTINSISPASGNVGTPVLLSGTNLNLVTAVAVNGANALILDKNSTSLRLLVMPGTTSGPITTLGGTPAASATAFTVTNAALSTTQQGAKLLGSGTIGNGISQGYSLALSANGSTLAVGGIYDDNVQGATWVFTRSGTGWSQQGAKLVGTGGVGANQGASVALSADGNTLAVSGDRDSNDNGATWVFARNGGAWSQQGPKLVGTGGVGVSRQGHGIALSADGNTLAVGGYPDNFYVGATWVFTRSGTSWAQQGPKLVGTGAAGVADQGYSVALAADGNTLAVGGVNDNNGVGASWVFLRSGTNWVQQGAKLVGSGAVGAADQGHSIALSADGSTLAVGGAYDNSALGATWVFTRNGANWAQQGAKLVGAGTTGNGNQGRSVALSAEGNTLAVGGDGDNSGMGATWVFTRGGTAWAQQGPRLLGSGAAGTARQGRSVALSADGTTLAVGGNGDNSTTGATWVFSSTGGPLAQRPAAPRVGVSFFPNPMCEQFTIIGGASVGTLRLFDGVGRTLLTLPYRPGQPINVTSLAPGCYWLRVNQEAPQPLIKY